MPEDGSLRPRRVRRLLIAIARAAALFILVTGIYGALTIALPRWPVLNRSIVALLAGVTVFEMLRPARRTVAASAARPEQELAPIADNSLELAEARSTIQLLRDELERARDREAEIRSEYERESEHLQRAAARALEEIQRTRAAHDESRGQLETERARSAASQQELDALRADRQRVARELEVARQKLEVDKTRLADLQREVDLTHATSQKVLQANETLKKQFEDERQRLQAELQRVVMESKAERDGVTTRLDELIAQLDRERKLSQELGATRARLDEENTALKKARDAAAAEMQSLRQRTARLEGDHKSALDQLEANWSAKLQKIVAELAADHENDIGEAIGEREAARAEVRSAQQHLSAAQRELAEARTREAALRAEREREQKTVGDLQQQLADARLQIDSAALERERALKELDEEWSAKLRKIVNGLTADHENDIGEAIAKREEARAELRAMNQRIGKLEHENQHLKQQLETKATMPMPAVVDEKALREKIDAEWSAKLQKIVNGLTADHENDVGEAIAKREEARAEARALQAKIARLENDIGTLQAQLEARAAAPVPPPVDETALREKIDAEWSGKLQTIVSHIASDHEADIGKAIEEREAARAEVRNLNIKMTGLHQKLEAERQARESLQTRFREVENQLRAMPTQPMRALDEPFPVQEPQQHEEETARANVLEFAEQAFEALKRATSPGTVPIPPVEEKKARILIVHHDPRFRAMWGDFLEKNGFAVQAAADGVEGLRVVKSDKPDAVIADAAMPKMDGRELCQMIKSNPETADVKVILLSGMYTNDVSQSTAKSDYEPDELLRKPVKLDAMKAALTNLLAERAAS